MTVRFASRPATEIYVNEALGITIKQDGEMGEADHIVVFSYQDIPQVIDALKKCAEEAEAIVKKENE